ncbi:MAG: 3-deoxy-D-manno-octulosonic acid transferase [Bacteroidetes bacterium]|nr:3-deoxy-D-manno-octulosonic acid transferase [Bacteroidota bacterium]
MLILYQIGLWIYYLAAWVISPFKPKARNWIQGRKDLSHHLSSVFPVKQRVIWFHAASLGEFEQGRPVIEAWREKHPEDFILLSFYSPSGYELRKNYSQANLVCYLPFDFPGQVRRFINLVQPEILVLIKYEFWPNLIKQLSFRKIPVFLLSARFRPDQLFFKWYGKAYLNLLRKFRKILVQDIESKTLLEAHGISEVFVTGDTRIDQVFSISQKVVEMADIEKFTDNSFVIIGGSTWPPEEAILQKYFEENARDTSGRKLKLIIAPHDIREAHLKKIENRFGSVCIRYSHIGSDSKDRRVLLIDNIGILSRLYRYGDVAFVGGGFGRGLHNILEPAAHGLPIIFGPRYHKFPEAKELIQKKAAFTIKKYDEFMGVMVPFRKEKNALSFAGAASREYTKSQLGATTLSISCLMEKL